MALEQQQYIAKDNDFYTYHYHHVIITLMVVMVLLMSATAAVLYEVYNRPLPQFTAVSPNGTKMLLIPSESPNLLPSTILRWASKAASVAYTFDFVNYNKQIALARPYFTTDGWADYQTSVKNLINTIVQNQIFVNGVVSGTPVVSNQGSLPGKDYVWRVQVPFLVTYQNANITTKRNFLVVLSVVRVPTSINKQGIGIDQFLMVQQ